MEGQCPECGLEFSWADVLDPSRVDLGWYVEHARSLWQMIQRTIPTLWLLLIPDRFWKRVGIVSQIRLGTLVVWSVLIVCFLHVLSTASLIFGIFVRDYTPYRRSVSFIELFTEFDSSVARKILEDKVWWYESVIAAAGHPYFERIWWWPEDAATLQALKALVLVYGFSAMWLLILSVIPTTRRLAKLRASHVMRTLVLSLVVPIVLVEIIRLVDAITVVMWNLTYNLYAVPVLASGLIYFLIVWVQWHWISAIRSGWKIRPCWLLILIGLFGSSVCSYLFASLLIVLYG